MTVMPPPGLRSGFRAMRVAWIGIGCMTALPLLSPPSFGAGTLAPTPAATFSVTRQSLTELAPVFGTVEGVRTLPARARISGTVAQIDVKDGDHVTADQTLATIADSTLLAQKSTLDAEVKGARAKLAEAQLDFNRTQRLVGQGAVSRASFDQARSVLRVAESALAATLSQRDTIGKQIDQGAVRAPHAGLVIHTPIAAGSVLMPGDVVAELAQAPFRVRLAVPERYTRFVHLGALIRVDGAELGAAPTLFGTIDEIKPGISDGRLIAYASVPNLPDRFVGIRVEAWLPAQEHQAIVVPENFLLTLSGSDYARLRLKDGSIIDVPIQRGAPRPTPAMPNGIEILSGLHTGDILVAPQAAQ
ncbi:efflux RND transporter periplasmic adaptor subunit [Acidiphilium sp.]|uniref:efflux RND transporter periplasmic adaptor subunit n=1 Tax=Acidiphilium sp. TaxID=527 RepID=UPI003D0034B3